MATTTATKIIQKDDISSLKKAINDFFTAIGNKLVFSVKLNAYALYQGNKIYIAVIAYDTATASPVNPSVNLFEEDGSTALQNAMNTYITATGNTPSLVDSTGILLFNGNNSFLGIVGYNISPPAGGGGFPYKEYVALITQAGTSAPTVEVLQNTIGALVWTYDGVGQYRATLAGAFPALGKTYLTLQSNVFGFNEIAYGSANHIAVFTVDIAGAGINSRLYHATIVIRVYP
ncbi:MAG: hypothetical protein V4721_16560 [Bacteroidota bacterium]